MSPVLQLVIELLVILVMIAWRMIIWVSSCLDPSGASGSMTQESVANRTAHSSRDVMTDTSCNRHDCQALNSILNLSRESNSLLKVWVSMRRNHSSDLREADIDFEARDEESLVSWVNVITFLKDIKMIGKAYSCLFSFWKSEKRTENWDIKDE